VEQKSKNHLDPGQMAGWTISDFLKKLSSEEPVPGGGSASALSGAIGAALIVMYCRLGIHRKGASSDDQEALQKISTEAASYEAQLTRLITEDSLAYGEVMEAFKLLKTTEEETKTRQTAIQKAFQRAVESPLAVLNACVECLFLVSEASVMGNPSAFSDLKVAQYLCEAGAKGAIENIDINLPSLKDQQFLAAINAKVAKLKSSLEQALHRKIAKPA